MSHFHLVAFAAEVHWKQEYPALAQVLSPELSSGWQDGGFAAPGLSTDTTHRIRVSHSTPGSLNMAYQTWKCISGVVIQTGKGCACTGETRGNTPRAVAPQHPEINDLQWKGETPDASHSPPADKSGVSGNVGQRGDTSYRKQQCCVPNVGTILVLIDLSFSRGNWARKPGIGLAPQQPCRQRTMKVETGKKEARLMFFRSQWSLVMGCRGKGQRRVRRVQGEGPACPTTALGLRTGGEPGMVWY